jgi:NAD(P) transhydrogenase subunit alpha
MKVAVLRETRADEHRVALVPAGVKSLIAAGIDVSIEAGAGEAAGFLDPAYAEEGATIAPDARSALEGARVVLKVAAPTIEEGHDEVALLSSGQAVISFMSPTTNLDLVSRLADSGVTSLAMDQIPRITRAQRMDALSSQANVAGYKAALIGADNLGKFLPMFMTAAGTIRPGKVMILGAGVAGLQAIATARRLGAVVEAFDVRAAVKEQVESLGAKFLEAEMEGDAEDEGGYAKELSADQHQRELDLIARHIPEADVVITTAQIPGRPAPVLVTRSMVESMKAGSVIVDLAGATGGNCELTRFGETVNHSGVKILAPTNLPSELPYHASEMYSKNITTYLLDMVEEGELNLDFDDEIVSSTCVTHGGKVVHDRTLERMGAGEN